MATSLELTAFRLSKQDKTRLRGLAKAWEMPMADVVRKLIRDAAKLQVEGEA